VTDEELGDEQGELIAPLLPQHKRHDQPRANDRRIVNGIPWFLGTGTAGRTYHQSMAAALLAIAG
jgi:transposase